MTVPPDPEGLADELEHEAARLQKQSERLHADVDGVREDWKRKRSDQSVPGALARPEDEKEETEDSGQDDLGEDGGDSRGEGEAEHSPAAEAPPEDESPDADAPPEGAVGPPADTGDSESQKGSD